jgi:hypothetical protein
MCYLFAGFSVKQYPTEFNDFCGVFCHVDAVFVTGRGYMNDNVAVQVVGSLLALGIGGGHGALIDGWTWQKAFVAG